MWADPLVAIRLASVCQAESVHKKEPRDGTREHPRVDAAEKICQQGQLAASHLDLDALQDVHGSQLGGDRGVIGLKAEMCQADQAGVSQFS